MISRDKLLAEMSQAISDELGVPDGVATKSAARTLFHKVYLSVVIPMLDAFEFDARPIYREMLIAQIRDLIAEPDPIPEADQERKSQKVWEDL
jgi:hypothetical protein